MQNRGENKLDPLGACAVPAALYPLPLTMITFRGSHNFLLQDCPIKCRMSITFEVQINNG